MSKNIYISNICERFIDIQEINTYKEARRRANFRLHFKALSVYRRGIDSDFQRP